MPTRSNRYFNNPQFAQIASNLAGMFAPPSATDTLAYEKASAERAEASRLADLWAQAGSDFDKRGIAAGLYNPNQSYYAVDTADATTRRGQDITAETSRLNNETTARYGLAGDLATTVVGEGERALGSTILDDEIAAAAGLVPGMSIEGRENPMSVDEVTAATMQALLRDDPSFGPQLAANELATAKVQDEQGRGRYAPAGEAAREGALVFEEQGSKPKLVFKVFQTPDGRTGTAVQDPSTGAMYDQATKAPLPQGTLFGDINDGSSSLTTSTQSAVQKSLLDIDLALSTAQSLQRLIATAPGSGGLVGSLRGTVQDMIATGDEVSQLFQEMSNGAQMDFSQGLVAPEVAEYVSTRAFDPNIPARKALTTLLAFQIAKANTPGRVSNEAVRKFEIALGEGGWFSNQANATASLDAIIRELETRRQVTANFTPGQGGAQTPAPAAPVEQPPRIGEIVDGYRFLGGDPSNEAHWERVQ